MLKSSDRDIKLFGRTITSLSAVSHYDPSSSLSPDQSKEASSSSSSSCSPLTRPNMVSGNNHEQGNSRLKGPCLMSHLNESLRAASEISSPRSSKTNGDQQSQITTTTSTSEDTPTTLKKPDKILPCPRCESANTKFCYYNNYNVSQPRYFCRNCQRYWTAGGSIRNVPVGSGRRKNKGRASSNRYLQVTSEDYENNNNSGTILSFGSSESSVTDTGKHQENKTHQGFLPPQVNLPNSSSPWPYQWSPLRPNTSFYPIPFYLGCTVPIWPTSETSPRLGKRSRDQTEVETKYTTTSEATKNVVWPKLPTKPEKKGLSLFNGFETRVATEEAWSPKRLSIYKQTLQRCLDYELQGEPAKIIKH